MTASPTHPDFFAENANKSATLPDAQVGLPSEEEIHAAMLEAQRAFRAERDANLAKQGYWPDRSPAPLDVLARAILDLIRPAFEAKEREVGELKGRLAVRMDYLVGLATTADRHVEAAAEARARSAEAKLAQAVEDEREACARIALPAVVPAEWQECDEWFTKLAEMKRIAASIRARAAARGEKT